MVAVVARVRAHDVGIVGERRDARHRNRGSRRSEGQREGRHPLMNLCARHREIDVAELAAPSSPVGGCIQRMHAPIWILMKNTLELTLARFNARNICTMYER